MLNKKIIIVVLSVAVVVLIAALLWRNGDKEIKVTEVQVAPEQATNTTPLPGGNTINEEQIVVTEAGTPVQVNVMPNNPEAPKAVVVSTKKLPQSAVQIKVGDSKFEPSTFTVQPGAPLSLAFSSIDKKVHVITFSDPSLAALSFGVGANQTKAMTFNAPSQPGEYEFHCDVPGHRAAGELGTMIVQ